MKVIFLDFDGVLNGYTPVYKKVADIAKKLHIGRLFHRVYDVFGIRFWKVFKLAIICAVTGAKVVLSSSWRAAYYMEYKEAGPRGQQLQRKMKFWRIPVIGRTKHVDGGIRGLEIKDYLDHYPEIDKFVILDDEKFDIEQYYKEELVLTSNGQVGTCYENSGLKFRHVKKAIEILGRR